MAFANAYGGRLLIGINKEREIVDVSISAERLQQWINQVKSITSPSIILDAEVLRHQDKRMKLPCFDLKTQSKDIGTDNLNISNHWKSIR